MATDIQLLLTVVGTVTAVIVGSVQLLRYMKEKPRLRVTDLWVELNKERSEYNAKVSFNLDNVGDRPTQINNLTVLLGPDPEVIEKPMFLEAHSTLRCPERKEAMITFSFPRKVTFLKDEPETYFDQDEELFISVTHTHGYLGRRYLLPAWKKWKKSDSWEKWYFVTPRRAYWSEFRERVNIFRARLLRREE